MCFVALELKMIPQKEFSFLPEWLQMRPFPSKAVTSGHNKVQERSRVFESLPQSIPEFKKSLQNAEVWEILSSTLGVKIWAHIKYLSS